MSKKTLLWVGDAVAHTGFATVTHNILAHLHETWNIHVLGVNYYGDPHKYPYMIWPASRNMHEDLYGIRRIGSLVEQLKPDVICILNDPWIVSQYIQPLKQITHRARLVCYVPVDGLNIAPAFATALHAFDAVITYTDFGYEQLVRGGFTGTKHVIPHGINTRQFYPIPRTDARRQLGLSDDWYIVGLVNRNQPRKRIDLAFDIFADWVADKPEHVRLFYHGAVHDVGWDIVQLAQYLGIEQRLILTDLSMTAAQGVSVDQLRTIYNSFDVQISTTLGEGWGLTTMEGMACEIPQIVPEWSALAEWARGGVYYVPCTERMVHTGGINTIGGVVDRRMFIDALDRFYYDVHTRLQYAKAGFRLVRHPKYQWSTIAQAFDVVFRGDGM